MAALAEWLDSIKGFDIVPPVAGVNPDQRAFALTFIGFRGDPIFTFLYLHKR
jgi:hypothetical protein